MQRTIICQSQDDTRDIVNLHGFSNTSQKTMERVFILGLFQKLGNISVNFVVAKPRLAPLTNINDSKIRTSRIFIT